MFPKSKPAPLPQWAIADLQLVLVSVQTAAQAQAHAAPPVSLTLASARAEPADPRRPVPAALYASALRAYQGFVEPQVAPWREANAPVRQRGGWRACAREARVPDAPLPTTGGASPPAPAAKPASGGHAGIQFKLARLLMLPTINLLESRRFEQICSAVALSVLSLASETRKAYFLAVAADETGRCMLQVQTAAEADAELARRQAQAGNWNKLQQAREQSFYADAALYVARSEQARSTARERLTRLRGLWGLQSECRLPERLPDFPKARDDLPDIEQTAMAQRLDVPAAKLGTEQVAMNLGLTRATRVIKVLEVGAVRNSRPVDGDAQTQRGYTISVELPLFDWGDARVAKAEAVYMQAVNRAAETAINARSEVRGAYKNYRTSDDIARHFGDEIMRRPGGFGRNGRHVQRSQGAQGPESRCLQGPGLVTAPEGHGRLRVDRFDARAHMLSVG